MSGRRFSRFDACQWFDVGIFDWLLHNRLAQSQVSKQVDSMGGGGVRADYFAVDHLRFLGGAGPTS